MADSFKTIFFRLYDRKIASGEIVFSQIGLSKDDFTALCSDPDFKLSKEKIQELCIKMKLNEDEAKRLMEAE